MARGINETKELTNMLTKMFNEDSLNNNINGQRDSDIRNYCRKQIKRS